MSPEHQLRREYEYTIPPVKLENAQFVDALEPEHEQAWRELAAYADQTDISIEDLMTPLWRNETLPQAFRDRALLAVVGDYRIRAGLGFTHYLTNGLFAFNGVGMDSYGRVSEVFDVTRFRDWTARAWRYQQETGVPIIDEQSYRRWYYTFFERGLIDEAAFDEFIARIDIRAASPIYQAGSTGLDGDYEPLDKDRFPLLDDIFHHETASKDDVRLREWAITQLCAWTQHQADPNQSIPSWLESATPDQGRNLYKSLVCRGKKPTSLSWDDVRTAISALGIGMFYGYDARQTVDIVRSIDDLEIQAMLVKEILRDQARRAAATGRHPGLYDVSVPDPRHPKRTIRVKATAIMRGVVQQADDPELKELFAAEVAREMAYEVQREQEHNEWRRQFEAQQKASPEYQEKQRKREACLGYIAQLCVRYGG